MARFAGFIVFFIVGIIWLSIEESMTENERKKSAQDYFNSLDSAVQGIITIVKFDTVKSAVEHPFTVAPNVLLIYKDGHQVKLWRDVNGASDSISSLAIESVKTLVIIQTIETNVGSYHNGAEALRQDYSLSFIKYPEFQKYGRKIIEGGSPPAAITRKAGDKFPGRGPRPSSEEVESVVRELITPVVITHEIRQRKKT